MTARIILALIMLAIAGGYLTWRMIGTGKGQHAAPRGWAEDSERLATTAERVIEAAIIPRAPTEHAPPWMPAPPVTGPEAYWIAAGTVTDEQVRTTHVAVVPALPDYVLAEIGHDGDTAAWVKSAWNRIQARELRELLAAEAVSGDG